MLARILLRRCGVSRRYRNRRIGEFLKELDLTEGRSTGIPKIFKKMAANRSPPPEFESDEDRTYFLIRLPVHEKVAKGITGENEAHDEAHDPLTEIESHLLALSAGKPQTTNELLQGHGYRSRTGNFKRALSNLLDQGYLEMTLPDKPRSKNQCYRLSEAGRQRLSSKENS